MDFKVITKKQQNANFNHCINALAKTTTTEELKQICKQVIAQTDSNFYLLSKEGKDQFWDQYRAKKAQLTENTAA